MNTLKFVCDCACDQQSCSIAIWASYPQLGFYMGMGQVGAGQKLYSYPSTLYPHAQMVWWQQTWGTASLATDLFD